MPTHKLLKTIFFICCVYTLFTLTSSTFIESNDKGQIDLADLAASNPDKYAWIKFSEFFAPINKTGKTMNWETWINEDNIYTSCNTKPIWPSQPQQDYLNDLKNHTLRSTIDTLMMEKIKASNGELSTTDFMYLTLNFEHPYLEESRINKDMFNYIVDNSLYNADTVRKMAVLNTIDLPSSAAIIKAQWKVIRPDQKDKYFWHIIKKSALAEKKDQFYGIETLGQEVIIGLAAFHIVTKELPNYVWMTFEHVDNPGRCDYIGCHDKFGYSPSVVEANKIDSLVYTEPAEMSSELALLFKQNNIRDELKNYRLKATQIDYLDNQGNPTLNGNSVLEANLVETSSCISCHARATVQYDIPANSLGMFASSMTSSFSLGKKVNTKKGFSPDCFNGLPIVKDYFPTNTDGKIAVDSIFYQTDFMWQFAQKAKSCD